MRKKYLLYIIIASGFILLSGCTTAGNGYATSQTETLSREVSQLRAALQQSEQDRTILAERLQELQGTHGLSGADLYPTYRTPSGFELPALDIQKALKNAGYYEGEIDGEIGPGSRKAIREFQKDSGLKADGVCGRKTWGHLKTFLHTSPSS